MNEDEIKLIEELKRILWMYKFERIEFTDIGRELYNNLDDIVEEWENVKQQSLI